MSMSKPLYQQIKTQLLQKISFMQPNTAIPAERILASEFNVSRMTVRKAIDELVDEGMLYRDKTRGTFVSGRELVKKNNVATLIKEDTTHVLYMNRRTFEEIAPILNLPVYEEIVRIVFECVRDHDVLRIDEVYTASSYYREEIGNIEKVLSIINSQGSYRITHTFIPMLVPVQFINLLNIPMNTPIIMVRSIYREMNGKIILMRKTYYNPLKDTIEISN